jgi:hypothetical protein
LENINVQSIDLINGNIESIRSHLIAELAHNNGKQGKKVSSLHQAWMSAAVEVDAWLAKKGIQQVS